MFRSGTIYTVHVNPNRKESSERVELVREGFSFWAFLLNGFWLLYHKLWIPFFIYLALTVYIVEGGARMGLNEATITLLQIGLQLLLAHSARDIQRWGLERRGYAMQGVVIGESELRASQRAYDRLAA